MTDPKFTTMRLKKSNRKFFAHIRKRVEAEQSKALGYNVTMDEDDALRIAAEFWLKAKGDAA